MKKALISLTALLAISLTPSISYAKVAFGTVMKGDIVNYFPNSQVRAVTSASLSATSGTEIALVDRQSSNINELAELFKQMAEKQCADDYMYVIDNVRTEHMIVSASKNILTSMEANVVCISGFN